MNIQNRKQTKFLTSTLSNDLWIGVLGILFLLIASTNLIRAAQPQQNNRNVASALNETFKRKAATDHNQINWTLSSLSEKQFSKAMDQISPGLYESLSDIVIGESNAIGQFLSQRFSAVRLAARALSMTESPSYTPIESKNPANKDFKQSKEILLSTPKNRWSVWAQGNGVFARKFASNAPENHQYKCNSGGVLGGADYRWARGLATGIYSGYQGISSPYFGGGRSIMNGVNFGTYINYDAPGNGFYTDAIIGGGYTHANVRRPIRFGEISRTALSQSNGGYFTSMLQSGYDVEIANFTFGAIAMGQYTYYGSTRFTEHGAGSLNLKVGHQNANSVRTSFGGRIAYTWKLNNQIAVIPEGRMLWQHEFLQYPRTISSSLDAGSGPTFAYSSPMPTRDAVLASAGIVIQLGSHVNLNAYYTADFGRPNFASHMINGGATVSF